jgi:hypothetical protein
MKVNCPLKCANCGKEYNRGSCYDKHKLLCWDPSMTPIIDDKIKDATMTEAIELCKTPSQLIKTVEELIKSNNQLKSEVAELKKWTQNEKKKFAPLDWLNKNCQPNQSYINYMDELVITRKDLETVFRSNLVNGIYEIIQSYINKLENNKYPLKAFKQKENKIYGYNEEDKWELIASTNFEPIILNISKNIINEFKKWQDENESRLYTEEFSTIYLENVKKVMGGSMSMEKTQKSIYKKLYKYLIIHDPIIT